MRCLNPACVQSQGQLAHYTQLYAQNVNFHLKLYFTMKLRQIHIYLDRWVPLMTNPRQIKSKVNSPLKIGKLFQFQNCVFSMTVLVDINTSSLRNALRT